MLCIDEKTPIAFSLSEGHRHDAPQGRELLQSVGSVTELLRKYDKNPETDITLIADKAYEGNKTRNLAKTLGYNLCIPPLSTRKEPWEYNIELYKTRNKVERIFRRIKEYRRVFTRYDKLDVIYLGFIFFAFIIEALL